MNADGSNPINLINHPGGNIEPSWLPDGTKIVFMSMLDGPCDIWVMNSDGTNKVNITNCSCRDRWCDTMTGIIDIPDSFKH